MEVSMRTKKDIEREAREFLTKTLYVPRPKTGKVGKFEKKFKPPRYIKRPWVYGGFNTK